MKTYILDLNLPMAKAWHQGVRASESSKHWGVGEAQEEEATPRAGRSGWRALETENGSPRPSLHLSPEPRGRGPGSVCLWSP